MFWKVIMRAYLKSLGGYVWATIEVGYQYLASIPTDNARKKRYENNAKEVNDILGALVESEFVKVVQLSTAKEIWNKLIQSYEGDTKDVNNLTLEQLHEILKAYEMRKGDT